LPKAPRTKRKLTVLGAKKLPKSVEFR
jgi:hypothetical protein